MGTAWNDSAVLAEMTGPAAVLGLAASAELPEMAASAGQDVMEALVAPVAKSTGYE